MPAPTSSTSASFPTGRASSTARGYSGRARSDSSAARPNPRARSFALRRHVGEHPGDQLVLADRLAHRLARLRILDRVVGGALRETETLRADSRPRAIEDSHRDLEAPALLAEQIGCGDARVVE